MRRERKKSLVPSFIEEIDCLSFSLSSGFVRTIPLRSIVDSNLQHPLEKASNKLTRFRRAVGSSGGIFLRSRQHSNFLYSHARMMGVFPWRKEMNILYVDLGMHYALDTMSSADMQLKVKGLERKLLSRTRSH